MRHQHALFNLRLNFSNALSYSITLYYFFRKKIHSTRLQSLNFLILVPCLFQNQKGITSSATSLQFSTDDLRNIYTIGKENKNNNKISQLFKKCPLFCYIAFGVTLFLIFGLIIALPTIVISSMKTTITMKSEHFKDFTLSSLSRLSLKYLENSQKNRADCRSGIVFELVSK